jgi:hypothetical protein
MTGKPLASWLRVLVLQAGLIAACVLVILLEMNVRSLREELRAERARSLLPAAGQVVPPVWAHTLSGDSLRLGEGPPGSRQVLFVFNTTCPICVEALPGWGSVAQRLASASHVSVLGWSQDSDTATAAYLAAHGLALRVVTGVPQTYLRLYRALGVPTTLVLDEIGNVLYGRPGILTAAAEDSIVWAARRSD